MVKVMLSGKVTFSGHRSSAFKLALAVFIFNMLDLIDTMQSIFLILFFHEELHVLCYLLHAAAFPFWSFASYISS